MRVERNRHFIISILTQACPALTSPETSIPQKEISQRSLVAGSSVNTPLAVAAGLCPYAEPRGQDQNESPWHPAVIRPKGTGSCYITENVEMLDRDAGGRKVRTKKKG